METLLAPPEKILQTGMDELHRETIDWVMELEFCKTELSFLGKLLDKYFLKIKGNQQLSELTKLDIKVRAFRGTTLNFLHRELVSHEKHIAELEEKKVRQQDEQIVREEHLKFDNDVKDFMRYVKNIKNEVFRFVEKELKSSTDSKKK